ACDDVREPARLLRDGGQAVPDRGRHRRGSIREPLGRHVHAQLAAAADAAERQLRERGRPRHGAERLRRPGRERRCDDRGRRAGDHRTRVLDGSGPYWIAVDGKNGATGRIVLSVSVSTAPLNDHFENAVSLSTSSGSVFGELADATADPGQPVPNIYDCCASVWYRFTAPATGTWRFDLAGTYAEAAVGV